MYTTIIHPIRKALCLSCNEYIVLDQIWRLSHNVKYGGWCIASKKKVAEWLDLSERTVFYAVEKLIIKGLVIKDEKTGWLKTTDEWNEQVANSHDWVVGFKGKETQYLSGKVKSANCIPSANFADDPMQNLQRGGANDSANFADYNKSIYNTNRRHSSGEASSPTVKPEKKRFGEFVQLTDSEHLSLSEFVGKDNLPALIDRMNDYCAAKGKRYKDYAAALRNWWRDRQDKGTMPSQTPREVSSKELREKMLNFDPQKYD